MSCRSDVTSSHLRKCEIRHLCCFKKMARVPPVSGCGVALVTGGGLGMGQRFQVLRCFCCGAFQVQQVKKSKKWSCKMCGEKQSLVKAYGQGSGSDCRRHVQKLNLLRAGMEVAAEGTSWYLKEPLNKQRETISMQDENLSWQEEEVKVSPLLSRWNKYLAKDSEDQEEQVFTDREQLYAHDRSTVEEKRKHKRRFHRGEVQENLEEKGTYGLTFQAKKIKTFESLKASTIEVEEDCADYVCDSIVVPAINEFWELERKQAPESAAVTTSKWEKFLLAPNCSKNMTLAVRKSSGMLETEGAHAGKFLMSDGYPQQEEESVSLGTGAQTEKSFTSSKHTAQKYASKLPCAALTAGVQTAFDSSHAPIGDVLFGKHKEHLSRAGSGVAETNDGRLGLACTVVPTTCLSKDGGTFASADPFGSSKGEPQLLRAADGHLFCTDDDFDDDL